LLSLCTSCAKPPDASTTPDGQTLLLTSASTVVMAPHLIRTPYDNARAFAGVGVVASMPFVLVVPKALPAQTVQELVALAQRPDSKVVYANAGAGSSSHLTTELFLQQASAEITEVAYRGGGPAIQADMSDEAQLTFLPTANVLPQIQSGDVRALAVTSRERDPLLPEVPTVAESGLPGFEVVEELVLLAPAGTPEPILRRLNAAVAAAMAAPETRERLRALAVTPTVGAVEAFPAHFAAENERWREVIRSRNIRVQ
jgi:tripartite-type tricarboxylate transporter receptor subunit TctC